ncbi:hypothetical protein B0I37DRAFT_363211 [Chaetomium sp. MPI-CAGE-AT-0009]|nr:hypothetical protein B0I37DRAFT_363211 [Chaetomium sp. MPI-CAGE-AT-0009]
MKTILVLLATTGLALAQDLPGQPDCATACLISAISAAGCGASDLGCQCGPTQSLIAASAVPCLLAACTDTQLLQAQSAGAAQCASYSATAAFQSATTTPASEAQSSSAATGDDVVPSTTATAAAPVDSFGSETSEPPTPVATSESAELTESTELATSTELTETTSPSTAAAAAMATPAIMGAGALLGVLGVAAAL